MHAKRRGNAFEADENLLIKPTSDLFIGIFLSNPANEWILLNLINAVRGNSGLPPIVAAEVLNPYSLQNFSVEKQIILDVLVKDDHGRYYNIEVQTNPHSGFLERILFGWAKTYAGQAQRGLDYHDLQPVSAIVITEFPFIPRSNQLHLQGLLMEKNEHLRIDILRLHPLFRSGFVYIGTISEQLAYWFSFLILGNPEESPMTEFTKKAMEVPVVQAAFRDPVIQAACQQYHQFRVDPNVRDLERRRQTFEFFQRRDLFIAKKEGIAEGEARGKKAQAREIARNLKEMNLPAAHIAQATGLTAEEIEKL